MAVILETSLGDLTIDLYTQERPRSCLNFLKLCKTKFYNFCLFHSVQRNAVAQTGDPTGTGRGGESIYTKIYGKQATYFDREVKPILKHKKVGTVSMVNNGSDMHGSQFFITTGEDLDYLDGVHTVFGEVSEGFDVLSKINEVFCDKDNRPYQDIRIYHTVVLDDPYEDPAGLEIPDRSPEPTKEQMDSGRIRADEDINDFKGMSHAEIEELLKEREAKANAQILEMVGDLPDADIKPPDNILFVCKLNPVTTDEDLEIIFSRFGTILSCEVIKDQKSGESLQYAFIEFESEESCSDAYFKMDNVLIDDRRIHVDFSQSVSKINWKGKGKGVEYHQTMGKKRNAESLEVKKKSRRNSGGYDLVFESDEEHSDKKSKKKKKHKARSRSRSPSPARKDLHRRDRNRDRKRRSHSRSRSQDRKNRHDRKRNRSRSKDRHRQHSRNNRSRSRSRDRHKR